jgi:Holliday junction resolvase RusA-like endonuclease
MELAASAAGGDGVTQLAIIGGADELLLDIIVPGTPKGAKRHRVSLRGSRPVMHHDDGHLAAEDRITRIAWSAWGGQPKLDEPLVVEITTWHRRPDRLKRKRDANDGARLYIGKPDADNVAKLVMDAITQAGVWKDDTRVADLVVRRRYLPLDERSIEVGVERTEVRVRRAT